MSEHASLTCLYEDALHHALQLDAREERLTGTPPHLQDRTTLQRVQEVEHRLLTLTNQARRGERLNGDLILATMAQLAFLEQALTHADMLRVETGTP